MVDVSEKDLDVERAAQKAVENDGVLTEVMEGILSRKDVVRSNCFKILLRISEENPHVLYPHWDSFAKLLKSDNTYQKYIAVYILSNLTRIDVEHRFERIFDTYYSLLDDESVIPAAHAALNSGKVARAKPHLQREITQRLLHIGETHHTLERQDLIKGYVIDAFSEYVEEAEDKEEILQFVREQVESTSPSTRKKARKFLEMQK